MKNKNHMKILAAALIFLLCITNVTPVFAGLKTVVRDNSTLQNEIDQSAWHNSNNDITAENGTIIIPKDSTSDTKLITKTKARVNEGVENVAKFNASLQFMSLPKSEKFIIAFGLNTIESELGESGNIEIAFTNDNGLNISINAYTKDEELIEILPKKKCGSLENTDVDIVLTAEQILILKISGVEICNAKVPVDGDGRIGFLQTGSCGVKISNIKVVTYDYDRPENCDINENFDNGAFNKNLLTSKLIHSSKSGYESFVGIDECNGSNAFFMKYPNLSYIGTKYKYSNFEMSFDIPFVQKGNEFDDNGSMINFGTQQIIVTFGGEGVSYSDYGHETAAERLLFRNISAITRKNEDTVNLQSTFPFFDSKYKDKGFSIKIRVVDSNVNIYMKWIEDTNWIEVMSYQFETPTGTIQIWGQDLCYFAIDNLKITNLDVNPNLKEVEYASSVIEVPEDFDYKPMEMIYKDTNIESSESNNSVDNKDFITITDEEENTLLSPYLFIPIVAVICLGTLVITFIIVKKTIPKHKEVSEDEKEM